MDSSSASKVLPVSEAIALVRGLEEAAWNSGPATGVKQIDSKLSQDCTLHGATWEAGRAKRGIDEIRGVYAIWRSAFPVSHLRVHSAIGAPFGHGHNLDKWGVLVSMRFTLALLHHGPLANLRPTGAKILIEVHCTYRVRASDRRVTEMHRAWDTAGFLRALGLRVDDPSSVPGVTLSNVVDTLTGRSPHVATPAPPWAPATGGAGPVSGGPGPSASHHHTWFGWHTEPRQQQATPFGGEPVTAVTPGEQSNGTRPASGSVLPPRPLPSGSPGSRTSVGNTGGGFLGGFLSPLSRARARTTQQPPTMSAQYLANGTHAALASGPSPALSDPTVSQPLAPAPPQFAPLSLRQHEVALTPDAAAAYTQMTAAEATSRHYSPAAVAARRGSVGHAARDATSLGSAGSVGPSPVHPLPVPPPASSSGSGSGSGGGGSVPMTATTTTAMHTRVSAPSASLSSASKGRAGIDEGGRPVSSMARPPRHPAHSLSAMDVLAASSRSRGGLLGPPDTTAANEVGKDGAPGVEGGGGEPVSPFAQPDIITPHAAPVLPPLPHAAPPPVSASDSFEPLSPLAAEREAEAGPNVLLPYAAATTLLQPGAAPVRPQEVESAQRRIQQEQARAELPAAGAGTAAHRQRKRRSVWAAIQRGWAKAVDTLNTPLPLTRDEIRAARARRKHAREIAATGVAVDDSGAQAETSAGPVAADSSA